VAQSDPDSARRRLAAEATMAQTSRVEGASKSTRAGAPHQRDCSAPSKERRLEPRVSEASSATNEVDSQDGDCRLESSIDLEEPEQSIEPTEEAVFGSLPGAARQGAPATPGAAQSGARILALLAEVAQAMPGMVQAPLMASCSAMTGAGDSPVATPPAAASPEEPASLTVAAEPLAALRPASPRRPRLKVLIFLEKGDT
jgi:hypothetical protein